MCNADDREGKSVQTLQDLPNKICQMQHKYLHLSHLTGVRDFSFLWLPRGTSPDSSMHGWRCRRRGWLYRALSPTLTTARRDC